MKEVAHVPSREFPAQVKFDPRLPQTEIVKRGFC